MLTLTEDQTLLLQRMVIKFLLELPKL